nr:hypothetical protein [uncultured Deefgea sp.]
MFKRNDVVKGVSHFEGLIDGQMIRSGVVFIEEALSVEKGNAKGMRAVEYKCKDADLAKVLLSYDYPLQAEITFEMETTKRAQKIIVSAVKPLPPQASANSPINQAKAA